MVIERPGQVVKPFDESLACVILTYIHQRIHTHPRDEFFGLTVVDWDDGIEDATNECMGITNRPAQILQVLVADAPSQTHWSVTQPNTHAVHAKSSAFIIQQLLQKTQLARRASSCLSGEAPYIFTRWRVFAQ